MNSKPIKIPGPDHPITITSTKGRVTVAVNGKRVADTHEALTLKEAAHPAVQYIPRKDVDMTQLQRTSHQTYCPYKGECAYYTPNSIHAANEGDEVHSLLVVQNSRDEIRRKVPSD